MSKDISSILDGWEYDPDNFSVRLMELTYTHVQLDAERQPNTVVVRLSDPLLFKCPILFMEDTGTLRFSSAEVANLKDYFAKGGFLYVDDFWGTSAWQQWTAEIGRVLPPSQFPVFDIPADHPILHALYDVKAVPQVSAINFWQRTGGSTSERAPTVRMPTSGALPTSAAA